MDISVTNIQLQIVSLRGEVMNTLMGEHPAESRSASFADALCSCHAGGDQRPGRNLALRDPEAGYQMMTRINQFENVIKAQHAELTQMADGVRHMESVGEDLGAVDSGMSDGDITARLQTFLGEYNAWEDRFDDKVADGGVLDRVQAAEISLYELEESIKSVFNGADEGVSGMADLGVTIDPLSHQASLNADRLASKLHENRTGVVAAIDAFSTNFTRSADLLNEKDNFFPRALDNRSRAIGYLADNRDGLQHEFGQGDAAHPTGDIAQALQAYNTASRIS